MEKEKAFEKRLAEVWARVEDARRRPEGSAQLMPGKKPRGLPLRPFPPYGKDDATSSGARD